MGMSRTQINIRCDPEMYKYLVTSFDDYSSYIRDLINNDRLKKADPVFIAQKEKELKAELQKLQDLKKIKPVQDDKIQDCLKYWHDVTKNQVFRDDQAIIKFCEKRILPNLRKLGYQGSVEDIADTLLNWPEDD